MAPESGDGGRRKRRLGLFLLLLVLVVVGAGVGAIVVDVGPRADEPNLVIDVNADVTPPGTQRTTATPVDPGTTDAPSTATPPDSPDETTPVTPTDPLGGTATPPATTPPPTTRSPAVPSPPTGPGETPTPPPTTPPGDDSLDLEFDGDSVILDYAGVLPGDRGTESVTLANSGSITGNLSVVNVSAIDRENGLVGAEVSVDDSPATGELSRHLRLAFSVRYPDGTTQYVFGTDDGPRTVADLADIQGRSPSRPLGPGERATVTVEWVLPATTGNVVQSDGVSVDVAFELRSEE